MQASDCADVPGRMEFETKFEEEKNHVLNQSLGTVQKGMEEAQVLWLLWDSLMQCLCMSGIVDVVWKSAMYTL